MRTVLVNSPIDALKLLEDYSRDQNKPVKMLVIKAIKRQVELFLLNC